MIFRGLRLVPLLLLLLLLVLYIPGLPVPHIGPVKVSATNASFTLYGSAQYTPTGKIGWGFTPATILDPGPDLVATAGQIVNMTLYSYDGITHQFCVDYEATPDFVCDSPTEPSSPPFSSRVVPTTFSFTASTTPGNYTYFCTVHLSDMMGKFVVQSSNDVAVSGISVSNSFAYQGVSMPPVQLNVTAVNQGGSTQTFYVSAKANSTLVGNQSITLGPGKTGIVQFSWTTMSLSRGDYVLVAEATKIPGEANTVNNIFNGGMMFTIRYKADVNNDCIVDVSDLAIIGASFGKTKGQPSYIVAADVNSDGVIDVSDLALLGSVFGQHC